MRLYVHPKDEKIHADYFDGSMVSVMDKIKTNLRLIGISMENLEEFWEIADVLGNHWYKLKSAVGTFHAVYKLLFAYMNIYDKEHNKRSEFHHLIHGPRHVVQNTAILIELLPILWYQMQHMEAKIKTTYRAKYQDLNTKLLVRINKAVDSVRVLCWNASDCFNSDGIPIAYDFI